MGIEILRSKKRWYISDSPNPKASIAAQIIEESPRVSVFNGATAEPSEAIAPGSPTAAKFLQINPNWKAEFLQQPNREDEIWYNDV